MIAQLITLDKALEKAQGKVCVCKPEPLACRPGSLQSVRVSAPSLSTAAQRHTVRRVLCRIRPGFFCPTPENVKSVERGFAQVLERFTPVYGISVSSNQGINVYF
jgi:hypothetical protein